MSFNLIHRKNGIETPIKVSVLDAFRPATFKEKHMKMIEQNAAASNHKNDGKEKNSKPVTAKPDSNHNKTNKLETQPTHSTSPHEEYSAEDDAKLIAMKTAQASWNDILAALGKKSKTQLQLRYKELAPKSEEDKKKVEEAKERAEKKKAEGLAKAETEKAAKKKEKEVSQEEKKGSRGDGGGGGAKRGKTPPLPSSASTKTTAPRTVQQQQEANLRAYVAKYEREKWLAAASRHYDLTGRRISPETAKMMFDKAAST